jgi:DNA-binding NarL/FixJ family response regulator
MAIRIVLADDESMFRELTTKLLRRHPDMKVVGSVGSGREAIRLAERLRPDITLMDIGMKDIDGIDATREIRRRSPKARVLALTVHGEERYVLAMVKAGASGFLDKASPVRELLAAIREVAQGRLYFPPRVAVTLAGFIQRDSQADLTHPLSERERDVLRLCAQDLPLKEVAGRLHLSVKTVETYKLRIKRKLQLKSPADFRRAAHGAAE